jgi:hypothetical protein
MLRRVAEVLGATIRVTIAPSAPAERKRRRRFSSAENALSKAVSRFACHRTP